MRISHGTTRDAAAGSILTGIEAEHHDALQERQRMTTESILFTIGVERARQIDVKGRTAEHDDCYADGALALAAALYALPYQIIQQDDYMYLHMRLELSCNWIISRNEDPRHRLIKAGALIVAEIERLDRAALKETTL